MELALNASLRHLSSKKYELLYIARNPWMSNFQRNWKHAIWSSVAPENLFRVHEG